MAVCVLTGCTSGLGLAILARLLEHVPRGSVILAGHRSPSPPPRPTPPHPSTRLVWIPLDLASLESVDRFTERVEQHVAPASIDCVLLNAATWNSSFKPTLAAGGATWSEEFVVNHLAQLRLVRRLAPLLAAQSRTVFTSSSLQNSVPLASIDDVVDVLKDPTHARSTPRNRYAASKLVQSVAFDQLQRALTTEVVGVSPGFVPTTGLSRDSPWWQQMVMRWLVYYLPFCSTEEQGATKILECLNYLFPTNPFPSSALDSQLAQTVRPSVGNADSPASCESSHVYAPDRAARASDRLTRVAFHPASLSPLESTSTAPLYHQLRQFMQQGATAYHDAPTGEAENEESRRAGARGAWEETMRQLTDGTAAT
ncbi:hypothetical protein JCM11491_004835 [Sporobolomyces phaffii]